MQKKCDGSAIQCLIDECDHVVLSSEDARHYIEFSHIAFHCHSIDPLLMQVDKFLHNIIPLIITVVVDDNVQPVSVESIHLEGADDDLS